MEAPYLWITGELTITGYAPDGDSVRFVPSRLATLRRLQDGDRVEPDPDDGSVQLRLDGIDAPEKAFQGEAQPLALPGGQRTAGGAVVGGGAGTVSVTADLLARSTNRALARSGAARHHGLRHHLADGPYGLCQAALFFPRSSNGCRCDARCT